MSVETIVTADAPVVDSVDTTPTTAAPEAPSTVDTGLAESDNPTLSTEGQPRDERGRFASSQAPDGTEPDTGSADDNADAVPDAPDAQAAAVQPPSPPAEESGEPFTITHRGQELGVQGAQLRSDGSLHVAPETVPLLRQMLASAREYQTFGRQREREFTTQVRTLEAQLGAKIDAFDRLGETVQIGDDVEAVKAFLALRSEWPALQHQAEKSRLEAELQALRGGQQNDAAPDEAQQMAVRVYDSAVKSFDEMRQQFPHLNELTEAERKQLLPEIAQRAYVYTREADENDQMLYGVEPGSPVIDRARYSQVVHMLAGPLVQQKQQAQAKARVDAAAEKARRANAARTGTPTTPPPAASTTVSAAPKKNDGSIDKDEWRRMKGG